MGLLNHIRRKEGAARGFIVAKNKRIPLWNKHLSDFTRKEELSKLFNFKNVDEAVSNWNSTIKTLEQVESLVSSEIISIGEEEKLDKEIFNDIKKLKTRDEIRAISEKWKTEIITQEKLLGIFHEIHDVLEAELHLIRKIKMKPSNAKELLLALFNLILFNEALLYKNFQEQYFYDTSNHQKISNLVRAILLEEELKEAIETDEEIFAKQMAKQMQQDETRRRYSALAKDIYSELAQLAGAPLPKEEDVSEAIEKMEAIMKDDEIMYGIIKKLRPRYDDKKIRVVMLAFRKAYDFGHFIDSDLEEEFV